MSADVWFEVQLLRVPPHLSVDEQRELDANAVHVDGRWWIFEGEVEFFETPVARWATGYTKSIHSSEVDDLKAHAVEIFDLNGWPPQPGTKRGYA